MDKENGKAIKTVCGDKRSGADPPDYDDHLPPGFGSQAAYFIVRRILGAVRETAPKNAPISGSLEVTLLGTVWGSLPNLVAIGDAKD